jgi:hypothetical protein
MGLWGRCAEAEVGLGGADSGVKGTEGCGKGNVEEEGVSEGVIIYPTFGVQNSPTKDADKASDPVLCLQNELQQQRAMLNRMNSTMLLILSKMSSGNAHLEESLPKPVQDSILFASVVPPVDAKQSGRAEVQQNQRDASPDRNLLASFCFSVGWLPDQWPMQEQHSHQEPPAVLPTDSD